jgi:glycosyltransferase involved in cell wall biosynthesis
MMAFAGKRVLMWLENLPYPRDIRVRQEADALVASGYQVSVICPAGPKQPWRERIAGVYVFRYPAPPAANSFLGYIWEYGYSLLASFVLSLLVSIHPGFDVIHAANPPDTAVIIAAFYKIFGKRFVYDHHDLMPEMYWERFGGKGNHFVHRVLIWLEKLSCRLADHVIATNQSYKTMEMQRGHVWEEHITIVRNGPALTKLQPVEPDPVLQEKGKIIIGFAGTMGYQDGVDYLLRALHHLEVDLGRKDYYCVIIGKGDAWASLNVLASRLGLQDRVWLTGFIPDADLLKYLSTADICVDPDPSNPFNDRCTMIKMMEYMALGKPIVAFDLPEHRVTAQNAALYARSNDELDFAQRISELMDDPGRRRKMGKFGRERVEKDLAWSHQKHCLLEAYAKLIGTA